MSAMWKNFFTSWTMAEMLGEFSSGPIGLDPPADGSKWDERGRFFTL